ncbi:MAG: nitroreductase family protein [Candidatus Aureabacteria bacterium]|nr:nitroreductase family protein [Candidatus Auribacterota bacterium]
MNRIICVAMCAVLSILYLVPVATAAGKLEPVQLVKPQTSGGKPLLEALAKRKSTRAFDARKLPPQVLSNLLWAACGVNRLESGKRTAPSAMNHQEIAVYAATADGLYLYNAKDHRLDPVFAEDIRARAGEQPFVKTAPVVLIYVADHSLMGDTPRDSRDFYSATDTGFISQNVYLYCASEGLATVVLGWVDKPALAKAMKLRDDQKIILTQPVGYPK